MYTKVRAAQFTRPADTTQYAAGDLLANSTTAGSVVPLQFNIASAGIRTGRVSGAQLRKSGSGVTTASYLLHLFKAAPTVTNGDNGAIVVNSMAHYLGSIAVDHATGGISIIGGARVKAGAASPAIPFSAISGGIIYGLLEVTGTYTPASAETWDAEIFLET